MLRLGHLKVVSWVSSQSNGARHRLERELAKLLTEPTSVRGPAVAWVAKYLQKKHLCAIRSSSRAADDSGSGSQHRYDGLVVDVDPAGELSLGVVDSADPEPNIWWQDWCLSQPEVRS